MLIALSFIASAGFCSFEIVGTVGLSSFPKLNVVFTLTCFCSAGGRLTILLASLVGVSTTFSSLGCSALISGFPKL
jgi:hypothetical protein